MCRLLKLKEVAEDIREEAEPSCLLSGISRVRMQVYDSSMCIRYTKY